VNGDGIPDLLISSRAEEAYVVFGFHTPAAPRFRRGDCNGDGATAGVTDPLFLLSYNFLGGPRPPCLAACDANADGRALGQVTDAVYLLTYNFLGGPPPLAPFPDCGSGTAADRTLGCERPPETCR
jgi:hypothetical protein